VICITFYSIVSPDIARVYPVQHVLTETVEDLGEGWSLGRLVSGATGFFPTSYARLLRLPTQEIAEQVNLGERRAWLPVQRAKDVNKGNSSVWCGSIPDQHCSKGQLRRTFGAFGEIAAVQLCPKFGRAAAGAPGTASWAIVSFQDFGAAQAALAAPVGALRLGGAVLVVRAAHKGDRLTVQEVGDLLGSNAQTFEALDVDGDGRVTAEELVDVSGADAEVVELAMSVYDTDADGAVSLDLLGAQNLQGQKFDVLDVDDDGQLTAAEVQAATGASLSVALAALEDLDTDGDGTLAHEEIKDRMVVAAAQPKSRHKPEPEPAPEPEPEPNVDASGSICVVASLSAGGVHAHSDGDSDSGGGGDDDDDGAGVGNMFSPLPPLASPGALSSATTEKESAVQGAQETISDDGALAPPPQSPLPRSIVKKRRKEGAEGEFEYKVRTKQVVASDSTAGAVTDDWMGAEHVTPEMVTRFERKLSEKKQEKKRRKKEAKKKQREEQHQQEHETEEVIG
jgi:Ca2+-binding EF-hand superfamily protein